MKALIKKTTSKTSRNKSKDASNDTIDINQVGNHSNSLGQMQMAEDQRFNKDNINLGNNALEYFGWTAIK